MIKATKAKKPAPEPITGATLDEIRNPDCTLCPLHAEGANTICMSGSGPLPARMAIIGEAPGYNEDREGTPFIGAAGQLLDAALAEIGIDRSEVFVTNAVRCVVPSTAIRLPSPASIGYRRHYEGTVRRIKTARGNELTITPNHPILTQRGWIAAKSLRVRDDYVYSLVADGRTAVEPEIDDMPASAEQVFNALQLRGELGRTVGHQVDFHGDGADSEVEIVWTDGDLFAEGHTEAGQLSSEPGVGSTALSARPFGSDRTTEATLSSSRRAPQAAVSVSGLPRSGRVGYTLVEIESTPVIPQDAVSVSRLGSLTERPAAIANSVQPISNRAVADAYASSDLLERLPIGVTADQIIDIDIERWSGHVYNFSTPEGWYCADGIITHNCRPSENRDPTLTEMKTCKPYLDAELALVKPELVLLLGNSAMKSVLKMSGITRKHGGAVERDGVTYLPVFHPAYVLRDPSHASAFAADMLAAKRILDGTTAPPVTKYHLIRTPGRLRRFLSLLERVEAPMALDIESSTTTGRPRGGLQTWAPDWRLDTLGICWKPGTSWVIALEHQEQDWTAYDGPATAKNMADSTWIYPALGQALRGKFLVGHNIKFDLTGLRMRGVRAKAGFDTLIAAHLLDENRSNSLKPLARMLLGAELYEDEIKYDGTDPLDKLALYNARDADYTLRLYHIFRTQLIENPRLARLFLLLLMPAANALLEIEQRGFPVSLPRLKRRHLEIKEKIREQISLMLAYVPENRRLTANFNSHVFLGWLLYEHFGLPIIAVSAKTKAPSTDKSVLFELRQLHPFVPLLLEYRKWFKAGSTYTRKWIDRIKLAQQARLYTSYNLARYMDNDSDGGTITGRLSSDMQQTPRDVFIRSIIAAPRGWRLVEADFSQIELRVVASVSGDAAMTAAYRAGADLHVLTASAITNKPPEAVAKGERQIAKSANFGLVYGMGWRKFREYSRTTYDIEMTDAQAQAIRNAFFRSYPGLAFWHQRQRRLVNGQGFVDSPIGRRRRLPAVHSGDKEVAAEAERQAINSPIQSFASDLTLLAIVLLEQQLDASYARIIGTIHDSLLIEVREDKVDEVSVLVKRVMETLPVKHLFGYQMPVPVVADVHSYQFWGEA